MPSIEDHIPSLTEEDEELIWDRLKNLYKEEVDVADLAVRTCSCGAHLEGFDGYYFHLKEVL